jgi:Purine nucleoside phosphorylase
MTPQSQYGREAASIAAEVIRTRAGSEAPAIGIVLGSGLGGLAGDIEEAVVIPFADIPGFPTATVIGHAGSVVIGKLAEKRVVALAGRFHMYEGHPPQLAAFPVRVMHALGREFISHQMRPAGSERI